MRVIVLEVKNLYLEDSTKLESLDTFLCRAHAEQWILNQAKNNRQFVILDLYVGGKN